MKALEDEGMNMTEVEYLFSSYFPQKIVNIFHTRDKLFLASLEQIINKSLDMTRMSWNRTRLNILKTHINNTTIPVNLNKTYLDHKRCFVILGVFIDKISNASKSLEDNSMHQSNHSCVLSLPHTFVYDKIH